MLDITEHIIIPFNEIEITAIRAQGAGGQHINKTSTAVQLKYQIKMSSLPDDVKDRLLLLQDSRISKKGVITIKAQKSRSQIQNKNNALNRLKAIIQCALKPHTPRKATKPTKASMKKRIEQKKQRGAVKELRKKVNL